MGPEEGVEDPVHLILIEEVVCIVECHQKYHLFLQEHSGDRVEDLLERGAGGRGEVTGESPVDLGEYGKLGVVNLAVDVNRHEFLCIFLNFRKYLPHAGGLARSRQSPADGVQGTPPPETGMDLESQFAYLALPVVELLRDVIDLKDLRVTKEGLIPHQEILFHPDRLSGILSLTGSSYMLCTKFGW